MHAMIPRQNFEQVATFVAVAEEGSFARAAQRLNTHPSSVSRRVAALEWRLGIRLIERSTRSMALTEAGIRFLQQSRAGLAQLADAEEEMLSTSSQPRGTLKIALPLAFGEQCISPLLPRFLKRYPEIRIEASFSDRYVDLIANGFDAAVRIGTQSDSRLIAVHLMDHSRKLFASPSYVAARGLPENPGDLVHHACLCYTSLASYPDWRLVRGNEIVSVRPHGPLEGDNSRSLLEAAIAGVGIGMFAEWLSANPLALGKLVSVLPDWSVAGRSDIVLVRPSIRLAPAKTRAFADWLISELRVASGAGSLSQAT